MRARLPARPAPLRLSDGWSRPASVALYYVCGVAACLPGRGSFGTRGWNHTRIELFPTFRTGLNCSWPAGGTDLRGAVPVLVRDHGLEWSTLLPERFVTTAARAVHG